MINISTNNLDDIYESILRDAELRSIHAIQHLINEGILIVEKYDGPHLVQLYDKSEVALAYSISIYSKEREYIDKLQAENTELKNSLKAIKKCINLGMENND